MNQPTPIVRYVMDYETVGRMDDPISVTVQLTDLAAKPEWSRERACWDCENWSASDGLGNLPNRRGVGVLCVQTCSGCIYSHLDQVRFDPTTATKTLEAMAGLRAGWKSIQSSKTKKGKPYKRALRWDSVSNEQGYAGRRAFRLSEHRPSSFKHGPNDANERVDCPFCGGKAAAKVERYWMTKKDTEPVRFMAIACMLGEKCGKRIASPEDTPWPVTFKTEEPKK